MHTRKWTRYPARTSYPTPCLICLASTACDALQCKEMTARTRALATLTLTAGLFSAFPMPAQQPVAPDAGCMQRKGEYTCNWSSFKTALDRAHTIAVQTDHLDRSTAAQLRHLIKELGKAPATGGEPADLTFAVNPVPLNGVDYGPGDYDLARLRVTASSPNGKPILLWAETYRGQGDRPWPAQVQALLSQFQERFTRNEGHSS